MILRPYQQLALDDIRGHYARGTKKVLLHLATGGGKTLIFCTVLKGVHAKGKRALMVVRGRKLIDQASRRLEREGVDHGVIMAGHWRNRPNLAVQICSIDTLYARRHKIVLPEADLIVIDEAHMATSPSFLWFISQYPNAFFLPVSATPHVAKGLKHVADVVVYPTTLAELIDEGFLVAPEYYAPSKPNLEGVKVDRKTGDYKLDDLAMAMEKANLYGDMVASYKRFANGLSALLFCVSVKHSQEVCAWFNASGIAAEHMDAGMPELNRTAILARLESGETKVVCNVGILTTGVDIPSLRCIMLARPTKSYNLYIQILGRGTRPYEGKEKFLVLDHADCIATHGFIERERRCDLEGTKGDDEGRPSLTTCTICSHVWDAAAQWEAKNPGTRGRDYICAGVIANEVCGHDNTPVKGGGTSGGERKVEVDEDYELKKIESIEAYEAEGVLGRIRTLAQLAITAGSGNPTGRVYHQLKVDPKYGPGVASKFYKRIRIIVKELEG